ncbi:PHP domain-containing protein [Paenibacillus xerothermodurans]|nr:PHP domain-containing protein [Paenibacillus xerothermodurans]
MMDLHTHSVYSDGRDSVEQIITTAIELGYQAIAITDHVWRTSDWVEDYASHIDLMKQRYGNEIHIFSGLEAKVMNLQGDIDAADKFDAMVDLLLGSIHRIPFEGGFYSASKDHSEPRLFENWFITFKRLLRNPRVDIVSHPLAELKRFNIQIHRQQKEEIARLLAESGKIIEINVRHNAPDQEMLDMLKHTSAKFVISSDSHSVHDLTMFCPEIRKMYAYPLNIASIPDLQLLKKS